MTFTPASSCMHCRTDGFISDDQAPYAGGTMRNRIRFYCSKCLRVWIVPLDEAEIQDRFLERISRGAAVLARQTDCHATKTAEPVAELEPETAGRDSTVANSAAISALTHDLAELRLRIEHAADTAPALSRRLAEVLHELVALTLVLA